MLKRRNKKSERGVALLVALFALILITAVGLGLIFSSNSEMTVNSSFRQNHLAYFAARSGLEEARDRMRYTSTETTTPSGMGLSDLLPTTPVGQANSVLYIVNGTGINPTDFNNNTYFDDELCHEINNTALILNSPGSFNIKCPHNANSLPPSTVAWAISPMKTAEAITGGGSIPYAWTRINLKLQESTNPWCVLGFGSCNPATGPDAVADQVCYDGTREFVLTDAMPLRDAPGGIGGVTPTSQLAMGMYFGGSNGHGTSGHSSTTSSSTTSSSTTGTSSTGSSGTSGTSSTGTSGTGTSSTGTSSTGTSSTGTSSTGTSSTGTSSTGTSSTGTSSTGTSSTGTSSTGTSSTGTSSTGTSSTGTSSTGTSSTGTSSTGTSSTGTSSTGTSSTGTSSTGTSSTGTSSTGTSSTGTSGTGTSSTGTSSTGTSSTGTSSTGGTTGGSSGNGAACSGVFAPAPPPSSFQAVSCSSIGAQPVYTLTTLAITPAKARRMLQYEIARLTVPPVPAALTMAGPSPTFKSPHSDKFGISGAQATGCSAGGDVPAIGTTTDVGNGTETASQVATDAENTIEGALTGPGVKTANFYGAGCSGSNVNPAGPGGDVQNVINVAPSYNSVSGLNAVVQSVIGSADVVTSDPSTVTNWGIPDSHGNFTPAVVAITGSADVSAASGGNGILLVTGDMTCSGDFTWNGTVLVIGTGSVTIGGGGHGNINGAMVVAKIGNSSYATDPTNPGDLLSQLGSPYFEFNGGGTNFLQYNSCLTTAGSAHATYKVLARREIVY